MRQNSILKLLDVAKEDIDFIKLHYKESDGNVKIQTQMYGGIKSVLENLRSCLDYSAHDVYETIVYPIKGAKNTIYFPYGKTKTIFKSAVYKNFCKDFDTQNKELYLLIESLQPFVSHSNWLIDLCSITNNIKHNDLPESTTLNGFDLRVGGATFIHASKKSTIFFKNCTFNGKTVDNLILSPSGIYSDTDLNKIGLSIIDWTNFIFKSSNIDILELFNTSYTNISEFQYNLYLKLDQVVSNQ